MEQTLVIIKPDGVQRGLVGTILARFEDRGLRIVALKLWKANRAQAERHYDVHRGKPFYEDLLNYIVLGPVAVMVLEGNDAIRVVRSMVGATDPIEAKPGTIRGDYGMGVLRNLVHASDSTESATKEIATWFDIEELQHYNREMDNWINDHYEVKNPSQ